MVTNWTGLWPTYKFDCTGVPNGHLLAYTGTSQYDWYHQIKLPKFFPPNLGHFGTANCTPWKLTRHWKITIFNTRYIDSFIFLSFQLFMKVSFPRCRLLISPTFFCSAGSKGDLAGASCCGDGLCTIGLGGSFAAWRHRPLGCWSVGLMGIFHP